MLFTIVMVICWGQIGVGAKSRGANRPSNSERGIQSASPCTTSRPFTITVPLCTQRTNRKPSVCVCVCEIYPRGLYLTILPVPVRITRAAKVANQRGAYYDPGRVAVHCVLPLGTPNRSTALQLAQRWRKPLEPRNCCLSTSRSRGGQPQAPPAPPKQRGSTSEMVHRYTWLSITRPTFPG